MARIGGLYVFQGNTATSFDGTPEILRQWDLHGDTGGVDAGLDTDTIRVDVPGDYFFSASLTFKGEVNTTYYAELRRNDARIASGLLAAQHVATAGKLYNMTVNGAHTLQKDDEISVYISSDNPDGADFTLVYGQLGVVNWL